MDYVVFLGGCRPPDAHQPKCSQAYGSILGDRWELPWIRVPRSAAQPRWLHPVACSISSNMYAVLCTQAHCVCVCYMYVPWASAGTGGGAAALPPLPGCHPPLARGMGTGAGIVPARRAASFRRVDEDDALRRPWFRRNPLALLPHPPGPPHPLHTPMDHHACCSSSVCRHASA